MTLQELGLLALLLLPAMLPGVIFFVGVGCWGIVQTHSGSLLGGEVALYTLQEA